MITIRVKEISIVEDKDGVDIIRLKTDLPTGMYPYTRNAIAEIKVAGGTGKLWVNNIERVHEITKM